MKNIVISGGKGYLGSVVTGVLIENGFNVINDWVDVSNEKVVKKYAEKIKNKFSNIFAVIHTASAPLVRKKVLEVSNEDFELQFKVNVIGAFNLFKYFYPLVSTGGAIIGVTSKAVERKTTHIQIGSYIPAKYALKGLLHVLSEELQQDGIRVYGVAPAFMPGGLNSDIPEKVMKFLEEKKSPDETTNPDEVAKIILELLEDESGSMNGKSIIIPDKTITDL